MQKIENMLNNGKKQTIPNQQWFQQYSENFKNQFKNLLAEIFHFKPKI